MTTYSLDLRCEDNPNPEAREAYQKWLERDQGTLRDYDILEIK